MKSTLMWGNQDFTVSVPTGSIPNNLQTGILALSTKDGQRRQTGISYGI
ncbi:MAG: hypothetical protein KDD63_01115 [Bacteroidetes bacterium]|nr:hypothetical protein [Bacteroidota bacterium]